MLGLDGGEGSKKFYICGTVSSYIKIRFMYIQKQPLL